MPSITLPDASKFDADTDRLDDSRPELKIMADAINTIGTDYNAGTLGGGIQEIVGGTGISVSSPDSAGSITLTNTGSTLPTWTASDIQTASYTSGGSSSLTLSSGKKVLIFSVNISTSPGLTLTIDIQNMAVNSTIMILVHPISLGGGGNHTYEVKAGGTTLVGPNNITLNNPTLYMHKVASLGTGNFWYHGHTGFTAYESSV